MTETMFTAPNGAEVLFGVQPRESGDGAARAAMPTGRPWTEPDGHASVGALGVMVDEILGYSLIDSLPVGSWTISTEIWIDVVSPLPTDGSTLHGEGRTRTTGSFAVGQVRDDAGRVVAECRQRGRQVADGPAEDFRAPDVAVPEHARDVCGVLGLTDHDYEYRLTVTPALENPRQVLHGGVSLCASEVAASRHRRSLGSSLATSSLHIVHLRAAPAGSAVRFVPTTVHAGRSLWVTDVVGLVDGRPCTTARVTAETAPD